MRAKSMAVAALVVLGLSAVALPASAGDADWSLRFGLLYGNPTGDLSDSGQTTELDESVGLFAAAEFRVSDLFGVEAGLERQDYDIEVEQAGLPDLDFGETTWTALTVNGNFHVLSGNRVDLYVGPTVGYVFWDKIEQPDSPFNVPTDDEFAIGANVGIDVPIGDSPWAFSGALRYLSTDLAIDGGSDIGVDPIHVKVGVSYDF